ncbi:minor tail protein GP26-like protein [Weissella oryzae SG25]|uniref:Minor tail protein GP26-like protein n=1 Tax=Weissella oryzae (strain DSM 25784 / JCM 18191 / LMG 30913 / SG25) TaxID=1329250 RepID=A0A069CUC2_WEIOS|nr:phage tail tape measure protein [Weissella oryzae]GAK31002.1 minor tail protein GP26-like protein [Weissella oryzae SG25]
MEEYTTKAILTASVGQFVAAFKEAGAAYQKFNNDINRSSMASTDAVANSSKLVSSAMKVSAVAVTALGVASIKTGADFEHQMSRVGAIAGASGSDLKAMNDQAIKLGADTAFSAKEAAGGMENLASAGMDSKQIMAAMPGVLNLAAVSGGDVAQSAENAATALNGFGLQASDSAHVADVFARAAADTNAEASDMGEALKMVAPQAHAAGLSLEETSAAIGVLSDAGIKGSMAGSNLGMALTKLQNPSDEASAAMSKIGFNAYDSSGKMKPLASQVSELKDKLSGMTDQQKQYYTSQIYGVQGGRAMNVLLSAQSGKLENLTSKLQNSNGAADEMAKTMQNDLSSSVEQFFGSLESLSIIVEETFSGTLKGAVDKATGSVSDFNKYLQANQDNIQKTTKNVLNAAQAMMQFLPSIQQVGAALKVALPVFIALETFKGIGVGGARTVQALETIQADLSLVQRGLIMTGTATQTMGGFTIGVFGKFTSVVKGTTVELLNFNKAMLSGEVSETYSAGINTMRMSISNLGSAITSIPEKTVNMSKSLFAAFTNPQVAVTGLNTKFYGLLQTVGASDTQIAKLTNTAMKNGAAIGTIGEAGAGASEGMLSGATAAGGLGMSLGALIPIALIVAAVAGSIALAWTSNFLNIQGVVKTAIGGIKDIFDAMKPSIDGVKTALAPIAGILGGVLKVVGAIAIGALVVSAIALATALRLVFDALSAIVQAAMAAGYAIEGAVQKMIPGGKDGSEAFDKAKNSINGTGAAVKDMESAFVDAGKIGVESFSQMAKSSDDSKDKFKAASVSVKDVGNAAKNMKTAFDSSKTKMSDLINTDGVSDKSKQFLTDVNNTLDQYQTSANKASENYKNAMTKAEKQTGEDRVAAVNDANTKLADATQKNGQSLLNITQDLDRQLKDKRFSDGTEMTADQANVLTDQNNVIKQKLIEQNEIFVQAQLSRVQNGQKLNETQRQATITTLQADYELQSQQVQVGEDKIKQLKDQISQTTDQTTKAQLQQQLVQQQQQNQSLLQQEQTFGMQMNQTISNGGQLNFQTWSQSLQNMNNVTAPQLQSMYLSFVQMNNDTGQQMQAFAFMLQQSGTQGVANLVQALSSGRATTKEVSAALAKDGTDGLNSLPPEMFNKGNDGKQQFINALKSGDFKGAGKFLAEQSASGARDDGKHNQAGKKNGDSYNDGVKSKKGESSSSGGELSDSSANGSKKNSNKHNQAGKDSGSEFVKGVKSKKSESSDAGKSLADAAKSGAKGVSFNSVGKQMSAGVAAGIRSGTGDAVAAMASLVAQVNNEAKKKAKIHSPSRLLRDEVGKYLSLGVATGISEHAYQASNSMAQLINNVRDVANVKPLDFSFRDSMPIFADVMPENNNIFMNESTNSLLRKLIDKNQTIILDTGVLVGETTDRYDDALGQNVQNSTRWGGIS